MLIFHEVNHWSEETRKRIDGFLESYFKNFSCPSTRLGQAMHYAVMGGGKRIRPLLVYASAELGADDLAAPDLDACAAALEAFHTYSLVHDDLPCMDDDDLRRGRATVHKAFDEATAMLVGDALQTLSFSFILESGLSENKKNRIMASLALAGGAKGMVSGQAIDLESVGLTLSQGQLEIMHRLKTGALIAASIEIGAIAAGVKPEDCERLKRFSALLGLGFQVIDDILDATSSTQILGKTAGKDAASDKPTFVTLLGLDQSKAYAQRLYQEILDELAVWGENAGLLKLLAHKVMHRDH